MRARIRVLGMTVLVVSAVVFAMLASRTVRMPSMDESSGVGPGRAALAVGSPPGDESLEEFESVGVEHARVAVEHPDTAPADPAPPAEVEPPKTGPEHWEELYADASYGQLVDAQRALQFALSDLTKDYYQREFDLGRYEVSFPVPNESGGYPVPAPDEWLTSVRVLPTMEMQVVRLPKEGFEEAYAMREHIAWLAERMWHVEKLRR